MSVKSASDTASDSPDTPFTFLLFKAIAFLQFFFRDKIEVLRTLVFLNSKCFTFFYLLFLELN